ncbi:MAG: polysaccharide deacetylase family protein [Gemmatimonadaceae bacterium]
MLQSVDKTTHRWVAYSRMSLVKRAFKRVIQLPGTAALFRPLLRDCGVIFMLHRFAVPDLGIEGDDAGQLKACLEGLRRAKREFLSLTDMFARLREGRPPRGALAFTIDDGYNEQVAVGGEAFAAFDCPVTVFATSGFLDGQLWFWWDQLEYIFTNAKARRVRVTLGDRDITYELADERARATALAEFTEACKKVPDAEKRRNIDALAAAAEVALPAKAPAKYAPVSWDDARRAERKGITFGPHTVTHPILSQTTDAQSEFEISQSWTRLRGELDKPVPVFCYPNGQATDFGSREISLLERLGLEGAVVGSNGYARASVFRGSGDARFLVPRFPFPPDFADLLQYVSGVERMKQLVRGAAA